MSFAVEEVDTGPSGSKNRPPILDYIYQGEVQIYQGHLDSFLHVAQKLKVEGLIIPIDDDVSNIAYEDRDEEKKTNVAVHDIKDEMDGGTGGVINRFSRAERTVAVTINDNSEAEEIIQKNLVKEDGVYNCKICNFSRRKKIDVTRHIETHIEGLSHSCSVCDKVFRSRNS